MTRDECVAMLATSPVGRVATSLPGQAPLVVPVTYILDGEVVVFRTDPGAKIDAIRQGPASFQLDHIDPVQRSGWSVLVRGVAYEATEEETRHLSLTPWVEGEKSHWVRLVPRSITGRRIQLPEITRDDRGYP